MILLQLYLYLYESSCNRLMIFSPRQLNETANYIVSVYLSLLIPKKFAVLWSISYRFIWRSLRRPVWISLLYFHRIHRIVILFGKIYKTFWTFFPLLRRKRIPRVTRTRGASQPRSGNFCNSKLAIRGEAIRDSRARVISKKKKNSSDRACATIEGLESL